MTKYKDVDVNSGDVRHRVLFLGRKMCERITESPFSHEIRRLDIPTPGTHEWRPVSVSSVTHSVTEEYSIAIVDCNHLVELLGLLGVSDEERKAILQNALLNLQEGKLDHTADMIADVAERLRSVYGLPPTPDEQRMKSRDRRLKM